MRNIFHPSLRLHSAQRILFAKRLALYLKAGIPLLESLALMRSDAHSFSQKTLIDSLARDVRNGLPLSHTLMKYPRVYPEWHVRLLAVGEQTGTLPSALSYLAELLSRQSGLRRSVLQSLAYPLFILCGTFGISGFLVFYAFPKIIPIFRGLHISLPLTTRCLIWIIDVVEHHGIAIGVTLFFSVSTCLFLMQRPRIRTWIDPLLLTAPFIGSCVQHYCLTTIFRSLHVLLTSGVRLDGAIELTYKSIRNTKYKTSLTEMQTYVLSGFKCTDYMRTQSRLYPPVYLQLFTAGERTGSLPESIQMAAELTEEAFSQELKSRMALVEPFLMVVMGFVVGFVALAIISPMYALTQGLSLQ